MTQWALGLPKVSEPRHVGEEDGLVAMAACDLEEMRVADQQDRPENWPSPPRDEIRDEIRVAQNWDRPYSAFRRRSRDIETRIAFER